MRIENIIETEELGKRLAKLRKENWKIDNMAKTVEGKNAKEIIDNWTSTTRKTLLNLLDIVENKEYKNVYHKKIISK